MKNHKLEGVPFEPARYSGGERHTDTLYIIAHDTAGASLESTVGYLKDPASPVSYHVLIGKNGEVVQMVPFDRIAYHAGKSKHPTKPWMTGLNSRSIGIAFDNAGKLDYDTKAGRNKTWFGQVVFNSESVDTKRGTFVAYTEKQREAFENIVLALDAEYGVDEILTHHEIAPNRKQDTNPSLDNFLRGLNAKIEDKTITSEFGYAVTAANLNLRSGPEYGFEVLAVIPRGTEVAVQGDPLPNEYVRVHYDGRIGFAHSTYLDGA